MLRPATREDAPQIAALIMQAMSADCCRFLYGPSHTAEEFHAFLTSLCECEDTQYSFRNTLCCCVDSEVAGVAVSYDGALLHQLRKPFIEGMMKTFDRDLSDIKDETAAGELYLDSLAVLDKYRRQGIGRQLIEATVAKAARLGIPRTGLLVDEDNPNAEHLYLSCGFCFVNYSEWSSHPMKHLQCSPPV